MSDQLALCPVHHHTIDSEHPCPTCLADGTHVLAGDDTQETTFGPLVNAVNPKDAIGALKIPLELWPAEATAMGSLGMLEGVEKYGRNNYLAANGVIASIYVAAAKRHLDAWFEGEDLTPDSKIPHLANALASIAIIVKAQAHGKLIDDRNYSPNEGAYRKFMDSLTPFVGRLKELFKDKHPKHWTINDNGRP